MKQITDNLTLPTHWNEVTYQQAMQCTELFKGDAQPTEQQALDLSINAICILAGVDIPDVDNLTVKQYTQALEAVKFIYEPILYQPKYGYKPQKVWRFIKAKDLKMDKWLTYEQLNKNPEQNKLAMLALLSEGNTPFELEQMPVTEVLYGFFMLGNKSRKSMLRSQLFLALRMWKILTKYQLTMLWRWITHPRLMLRLRKNRKLYNQSSSNNGAGLTSVGR